MLSDIPALASSIKRNANSFDRFANKTLPQTTAIMRKMLATSGNSASAIGNSISVNSNKLNKDTLVRLNTEDIVSAMNTALAELANAMS